MDIDQAANDLIQKGYTRQLYKLIRRFVAPIYWYDDNKEVGKKVLHNGTMFFVNTGDRIIGITADHVLKGFETDFAENSAIECALIDKRFHPSKCLIDRDEKQDIATFSISKQFLYKLDRSAHSPPSWPPELLKSSEIPIICGLPGCLRIENGYTIDWAHWIGILWIDEPGPYNSLIEIDRKNIVDDPNIQTLPEGKSLGGCSGGPMFAMEYTPIWKWRVAGLVSEGPESFEALIIKTISNIDTDGTINRL